MWGHVYCLHFASLFMEKKTDDCYLYTFLISQQHLIQIFWIDKMAVSEHPFIFYAPDDSSKNHPRQTRHPKINRKALNVLKDRTNIIDTTASKTPSQRSSRSSQSRSTDNVASPEKETSNEPVGTEDADLNKVKNSQWTLEQLKYFCFKLAELKNFRVPQSNMLNADGLKAIEGFMKTEFPLAAKAKKFEGKKIKRELLLLIDDYINGFLYVMRNSSGAQYSEEKKHFVIEDNKGGRSRKKDDSVTNEIFNLEESQAAQKKKIKKSRFHRMFNDDVSFYQDVAKYVTIDYENKSQYSVDEITRGTRQLQHDAIRLNQVTGNEDDIPELVKGIEAYKDKRLSDFLNYLDVLVSLKKITTEDRSKIMMNVKASDLIVSICTSELTPQERKFPVIRDYLSCITKTASSTHGTA